jgi:hypothetical protein
MMKMPLKTVGFAATLLIACDFVCFAADDYKLATLKGLQHVAVVIEKLPDEVRNDGLRSQQLRADVKSQFRKAGLEIIARGDTTQPYGPPRLYVNVDAEKTKYCGYAVNLRVELRQAVLLLQNPGDSTLAATWHANLAGVVPVHKMSQMLRGWLVEIINEFVNDYLAANPEQVTGN